jgi:SSS family solute:Na+ symporter
MIGWTQGATFWSPLWLTIYSTIILGVGIGVLAQPQLSVRFMTVKTEAALRRAVIYGGVFILTMTGVAFVVGSLTNVIFFQQMGMLDKVVDGVSKKIPAISVVVAGGNIDKIIPTYIEKMFPEWFGMIFVVAMFAAAMSTLSAQYHAGGTSLGRDFYERGIHGKGDTLMITRVGVGLTIIATLLWGYFLPESIIALATAFFFGLCSSSFLPVLVLGLWWRGMTWAGAVWSMVGGFTISTLWAILIHNKEATALGISNLLIGQPTIVSGYLPMSFMWKLQYLDQNVVALPIAFIIAWVVSLITKPMDQRHLERCWRNF